MPEIKAYSMGALESPSLDENIKFKITNKRVNPDGSSTQLELELTLGVRQSDYLSVLKNSKLLFEEMKEIFKG